MKYKGVVYDVGLKYEENTPSSVEPFDEALVKYDINTIAKDLHANTVRIEGEEIKRLVTATRLAHAAGLTVFFNPWKMNVPVEELAGYYVEAAIAAEELRKEGVELVFVCGCEITMFNKGIFPGETILERANWLGSHTAGGDSHPLQQQSLQLNNILSTIVTEVRKQFYGNVTYSSGAWEAVDWSLFDIVGVDYYRYAETAEQYVSGLDRYRINKPLVVMEVGCCTFKGAGPLGAGGFMLLEGQNADGTGKFRDGVVPVRSEQEQADYVSEQLQLLSDAGVDGVFIFVFSFPVHRLGEGAKDMDMMSYSLVKTFPDNDSRSTLMPPWAPKKSFYSVADFYKKH